MKERQSFEIYNEDYRQSANTLFHFMKEAKYLNDILNRKAIIPRYCIENIEYLKIKQGDNNFKEIAVLQKCFCDIPFHKLSEKYSLNGVGENFDKLSDEEKKSASSNNTHTDFYGEYAIAFSKKWGETHNLQPIHYVNEYSSFFTEFLEYSNYCLNSDEVSDIVVNDFLSRLSFVKPIRGIMKRKVKKSEKNEYVDVEFYKNFHDEKEWRYVPKQIKTTSLKMENVIANPHILKSQDYNCYKISDELVNEKFRSLWLSYEYDEIRYLIVPNSRARIEMIETIMNIPDKMFQKQSDILTQKYILISKIVVLDEIRRDC